MTPTPTPTPTRPSRRPLHGLLTATGVSVAANAMVAVLVPWLVLARTGSPALAGLVGAAALAAAVPALVLGGPLIDRWGRRRVAAGADLVGAVAVAALPLLDLTVGLGLVATLVLVAAGAVFDGPGAAAREAARPEVARASGTTTDAVNARGEAAEQFGEIAGPAIAGVGIGVVGALSSLWVAAGLLLVAGLVTWCTQPDQVARRSGDDVGAGPRGTPEPYLTAVRTGLATVWRDRTLRATALLTAVAMLFFAPLTLIVTTHLEGRGEPDGLALVTAALGVGALLGALAYGRLAARLRRRTVLLAGLVVAAAGLALMALLPPTPALAALAFLVGAALGPLGPALAAITQIRTPRELRGRVVSTQWSLSLTATPLGVLGAGLLLEWTDPGTALLVVAAGVLTTAVLAALSTGLRQADPNTITEVSS
jgi:MFS family permease